MPGDFPTDHYHAVYDKSLNKVSATSPNEFAGAWNAVAYRFLAMADEEQKFTALIVNTAPKPSIRYEQERSLFGFYSNGFSVFEATFYALFALGALVLPDHFPIATAKDQQRISPYSTSTAFTKAFTADPINSLIRGILASVEFIELREVRNILTHRAAPGRTFFVSFGDVADAPLADQWKIKGIPLDTQMASSRRAQLSYQLERLLCGVQDFTDRYF